MVLLPENVDAVLKKLERMNKDFSLDPKDYPDYKRPEYQTYPDIRLQQIPRGTGEFLITMIVASGARNIIEFGTSVGYSTIWLALGAQKTQGHVTTFEYFKPKIDMATGNFQEAGLDEIITIVEGDYKKTLEKIKEPVDFVFIDCNKLDYGFLFRKILPVVRKHGVVIADNITSHFQHLNDFFDALSENKEHVQNMLLPIGTGEMITIKL